jgi:hypothetical protein
MKARLCFPVVAVLFVATLSPLRCDARELPSAASASPQESTPPSESIIIPGPMRSFLRMAAISQKVAPDEITPLLARNVFLLGYEGPQNQAHQTEFLILLNRYVQQARDLVTLAGSSGVIRVTNCEDAKPLLQVLGYRVRPDCGQKGTYLETVDPQRAFLTIDSGFPLPELEKALQELKPFEYPYTTTRVSALFTDNDWSAVKKGSGREGKDLLDLLLHDSLVARLYWSVAKMDSETQAAIRQSPVFKKLRLCHCLSLRQSNRYQYKARRLVLWCTDTRIVSVPAKPFRARGEGIRNRW